MRKLVLAIVAVLFASVASAQTPTPIPNMFETMDACRASYFAGNYRVYEPKFFGLNSTNPVNGESRVAAPLEHDACVRLKTTAGMKYVVQREGTGYRFEINNNGNLRVYARNDCGNPADEILYLIPPALPAETPNPEMLVAPAPAVPMAQAIAVNSNGNCSICPEEQKPIILAPRPRGWCGMRSNTACNVLTGVLIAGAVALSQGGGGDDHEQVTTLPPCTSLPCN